MMKPLFSAQQLLESEQRVASLRSMIPTFIDEYTIHAQLKREKFNALVREGFTDEQAMQIIIAGKDTLNL